MIKHIGIYLGIIGPRLKGMYASIRHTTTQHTGSSFIFYSQNFNLFIDTHNLNVQ